MIRGREGSRALALWAWAAGLALWAPAVALPGLPLPLQPMDAVTLLGWPLLALLGRRLPPAALGILLTGLISVGLSATLAGAEPLILAWTLGFGFPFLCLAALVAADPLAAPAFLRAFLLGATATFALFFLQIAFGAETLDFRSNPAFRLPPHYGRGFALFPEVSTFAAHAVVVLGAALALALHPQTARAARRSILLFAGAAAIALLFTRSTSVLLLLPALVALALAMTTRASLNTLILAALLTGLVALLLGVFLQSFYVERLAADSAQRSAAMRLSSILGGLSPLVSGELFGVGVGQNAEIRYRAYEVARDLGLSFGALPDGVNSQIVGRIFEEGWPAVLHLGVSLTVLARALAVVRGPVAVALACIAAGAALAAAGVIGYRGIYTTWLWLGLPAGLLAGVATRPREPVTDARVPA